MGFPRQEYWTGLPFPSPVDLPNSGTELKSPALTGRFFTTGHLVGGGINQELRMNIDTLYKTDNQQEPTCIA